MTPERREEIRKIAKETFSTVNGDLQFSEAVSNRTDLNIVEKIYAGCIVREFLFNNIKEKTQ